MMDWRHYQRLLDEKVSDAWYNWERAEKAQRAAKAAYDAVLLEKKAFEGALDDLMEKDVLKEAVEIMSLTPSRF